ncbi:efflux RND transporter periplasmic adaptor subunit [Azotobacter beijerinckii]|uniref:efflux RND transporter periplasmic adaptor subunit n=1 Tax=Azotobacter beijerinckii TaxID=170623 RepID=UPI0029556AE3|nr:efflux RND transporter periplasmic adaptor subunit [Azotobacter beijerinckii]MDV7211537.1 efflux RND transporter periplasmic adaptor subunit [Azotobacter beijerinckii]
MNGVHRAWSARRYVRFAAWALAPIGAALLFHAYRSDGASAAPARLEDMAVPVVMQPVRQQELQIWLDAIGNVEPLNSVSVRVRVDGQLQQVLFGEGHMVEAGSLLAQIDPRVYQAQVAQAEAMLARDRAQLENLRISLDRATKLAAAKAGPTQDVDTYRAQLAAQRATVQADQAALDNARLQLSFTRITAPLTGRTGRRLLDVGSIVHGSDATGLVTITQIDPIAVTFSVSQDDLAQILEENSRQPLRVVALTRDGSQQIATGQLSFIDNQVATATGQIQLKAQFENGTQHLWPGQLVSVRLLLHTERAATVVPASSVQLGQQGPFVYVVDAGQQAQSRLVRTAAVVDGQQWIAAGLQPGETVVIQGQYRIAPGVRVSPVQPDQGGEAKTIAAANEETAP